MGASIGSMVGGIAGDMTGSRYGYQMGAIVGTVAGAAAGQAIANGSRQKQQAQQQSDTSSEAVQTTATSALSVGNVVFYDENDNQAVDATEKCRVTFDIVNNGSHPVSGFTPMLELVSRNKGVSVGATGPVGRINAGSTVTYGVPLQAAKSLKNGEATFQIYAIEANGNVSEVQEFSLPTRKK